MKNIHKLILIIVLVSSSAFPLEVSAAPVPTVPEMKKLLEGAMKKRDNIKDFWAKMRTQYGHEAVKPILSILENDRERDELRWASLFGVARMAGEKSYNVLKKYANDRSWILRDASLRAIAALNATSLSSTVETALRDKALVVRTTAVDVIGHLQLKSAYPKLLEALNDPLNFRGTHPLWIHDHVFHVISEQNYTKAVGPLVELLEKRKDPKYQAKVIATLEKLTGKSFNGKSIQEQVYLWKRNTVSEKTF